MKELTPEIFDEYNECWKQCKGRYPLEDSLAHLDAVTIGLQTIVLLEQIATALEEIQTTLSLLTVEKEYP